MISVTSPYQVKCGSTTTQRNKSLMNLPPREREQSKKTTITTSLNYQSVYNQFEMKEDIMKNKTRNIMKIEAINNLFL